MIFFVVFSPIFERTPISLIPILFLSRSALAATIVTFSLLLFSGTTAHGQSTTFNGVQVPGVVINHSPKSSGIYLASPSIAILPNGDYIATHDETGPSSSNSTSGITQVFRSTDRGLTWSSASSIDGQFWSGLFVQDQDVYILGTRNGSKGDLVIRRSTDGGSTWTTPSRAGSGLLLESPDTYGYHTSSVPVVEHNGRIWRAFEDKGNGGGFANHFRVGMMSAPVGSDLLDANNWTFTNVLVRDKDWLDGTEPGTNIPMEGQGFNGWLEGNAVVDRNGHVVNVLRVDVDRGQPEKAAIARVTSPTTLTFDPGNDIVDMNGAAKKFSIRYHEGTDKYWTVANIVTDANQDTSLTPSSIRNIMAVQSSDDLVTWEIERIIVEDLRDVHNIAFQYMDWQFDDNDIVAVSRTAFPDGLGGADRFHNGNFFTFHRAVGVVPEPNIAALLGGVILMGFCRRNRKRS